MSGCESDTCGRSYTIRIRYVWTQIFLYPHKKNLRIQKSPDTCGRGLRPLTLCSREQSTSHVHAYASNELKKKNNEQRNQRTQSKFRWGRHKTFLKTLSKPQNFIKVMLHETIRNVDFQCNTASQYCCDIASNAFNIVPILRRYFALKIVVANRFV